MKTLKLFSLFMLISVCSFSFVACEQNNDVSKDSESETVEIDERDIEGLWVHETRSAYEAFEFEDGEYGYAYEDEDSYTEDYGEYSISGNKLKLESYETGDRTTLKISLKKDVLTIDGVEFEKYD